MDYKTIVEESEKAFMLDYASRIIEQATRIRIGIPDFRVDGGFYYVDFQNPSAIECLKLACEKERDFLSQKMKAAMDILEPTGNIPY